MSLKIKSLPEVPTETARVAKAAFPKGNLWLRLRDELGVIYQDAEFATLFAECGQPALAPWRLSLVSVLQFAEGLTDQQAAEAVRSRLDWKYLLHLPIDHLGCTAHALKIVRKRLLALPTGIPVVRAILTGLGTNTFPLTLDLQ